MAALSPPGSNGPPPFPIKLPLWWYAADQYTPASATGTTAVYVAPAAIGASTQATTTGGTSVSTPTTGVTTSGSGSAFWVGVVTDGALPVISTVNDSFGNTYSHIGSSLAVGSPLRIDRYYCAQGVGGSNHYWTVTWASASYATVFAVEIQNAASSPLDQSATNVQNTDPVVIGPVTLNPAIAGNEVFLSLFTTDYSGTPLFFVGGLGNLSFVQQYTGSYTPAAVAGAVVSQNGLYSASWSDAGAIQNRGGSIDTFQGLSSTGIVEQPDYVVGVGTTSSGSATGVAAIVEGYDLGGGDLAAGTGTLTVTGTAAITELSDQDAGTGTLTVTGTAAITELSDQDAGTGTLTVTGTAAITELSDQDAGTGTLTATGTAAITELSDQDAGTGTLTVTGTAAITELSDQDAGTGTLTVTGTAAIVEFPQDITAGAGSAASGPNGVAAIVEGYDLGGSDYAQGNGTLAVAGASAQTEQADLAAGSGTLAVSGAGAVTESTDTATGAGNLSVSGAGTVYEQNDLVSGFGTALNGLVGAASIVEGYDLGGSDYVQATGYLSVSGAGSANELNDVVAGAGTISIFGLAAIVEQVDVSSGLDVATSSVPSAYRRLEAQKRAIIQGQDAVHLQQRQILVDLVERIEAEDDEDDALLLF